jgi:AcrR family transcriptional regulator
LKRTISPNAPRQLSAAKEQLLLDKAREVFQEQGVGNATMDEIARQAGIGKATIYRRFASKEELFERVVMVASEAIANELSDLELNPETPEQSLLDAAIQFRNLVHKHVEFQRLVLSEARRYEALCQASRKRMNALVESKLKAFFTVLRKDGRMEHGNIESATWTFFIVAAGGMRALFNIEMNSEQEELRWAADMQLFIRGCGIR